MIQERELKLIPKRIGKEWQNSDKHLKKPSQYLPISSNLLHQGKMNGTTEKTSILRSKQKSISA